MGVVELVQGCVAALAGGAGCACRWAEARNRAPIAGCTKAGTPGEDRCAGQPACVAASASAAACEAFCCHGPDGAGPPTVESGPSPPAESAKGPCGAWQV